MWPIRVITGFVKFNSGPDYKHGGVSMNFEAPSFIFDFRLIEPEAKIDYRIYFEEKGLMSVFLKFR
jgi:hypothetical protein